MNRIGFSIPFDGHPAAIPIIPASTRFNLRTTPLVFERPRQSRACTLSLVRDHFLCGEVHADQKGGTAPRQEKPVHSPKKLAAYELIMAADTRRIARLRISPVAESPVSLASKLTIKLDLLMGPGSL
jgi:hypothetical protein